MIELSPDDKMSPQLLRLLSEVDQGKSTLCMMLQSMPPEECHEKINRLGEETKNLAGVDPDRHLISYAAYIGMMVVLLDDYETRKLLQQENS